MRIKKRDARVEDFSSSKLIKAISKCFDEVHNTNQALVYEIANSVQNKISDNTAVETIQDLVEREMVSRGMYDEAKAYIIYRHDRAKARDANTQLTKIFDDINKIESSELDLKRENANIDTNTSMGTMLKIGTEASKDYNLKYLIKPKFTMLHENGDFHVHDLDFYSITMNCLFIPLAKLLKNGFNTGHGTVREPQSVKTAANLACIILQSNQNEMFGGQAFPTFDYDLAPYVAKSFVNHLVECLNDYYDFEDTENDFKGLLTKEITNEIYRKYDTILNDEAKKDLFDLVDIENDIFEKIYKRALKKTDKETYQAMEALIHNFNTMHSRCLPADEKIVVKDGYKNINKLKVNDYVLSFNVETQKYEYKKVKRVLDNGEKELLLLVLENGQRLRCTPDHKLYTSKGYTEAQYATDVLTKDGFSSIVFKKNDITEEVYDIEVEDNHNFCVKDKNSDNFVVVHNCGAQTPFSSINYGTCTTEEGRLITKNVLLATDKGLGRSETPIFPVQIFKLKRSVNTRPDSKNYDLFKLAIKTSAKRLFPNFTFCDSPYNAQYYKEGHPETEIAVMGCFFRDETITIKYKNKLYENIKGCDAFNLLKSEFGLSVDNGKSEYVKLSGVEILDDNGFTECKGILKNHKVNNWVKVKTPVNELILTDDHPLSVNGKRTFVKDINLDLENTIVYNNKNVKIISIEKLDLIDDSFDVETESDKFILSNVVSHNCRTRVIGNTYDKEHEQVTGRGNFSFNTLNLPRLGILAKGDLKKFFRDLDNLIDDAIQQLKDRFEYIGNKHVYNYPFLMGQGVYLDSEKFKTNDKIKEILKQSSISVGFCGLAECLTALTGKHHGESEKSRELGLEIIGHIRKRMDEESKKTGLSWSCFATPAESTAGTFLRKDRKIFGVIPGVTDKDYYTNSFHLPVNFKTSIVNKIDIEAPYHEICNAGSITYVELDGDPNKNLSAYETIVRYAMDRNLQYFSINTQNDQCPVCGYLGIIGDECPHCGFREDTGVTVEHLKELGIYDEVLRYNQ